MATEFVPVYWYSLEEAKRLGEIDRWRSSYDENVLCKQVIEETIKNSFDGMRLTADCAERIVTKFGYGRVQFVLANTVQQKEHDGRFSHENKKWADATFIPEDKYKKNLDYVVESHPAILDGFINQYRKAFEKLELFNHTHCEPNSMEQDYKGKVLVLSPRSLSEQYWSQENQLWLATGGFGCSSTGSGRAVFAICLGDGENTRLNRSDFIGVLKESLLPDWAREALDKLQGQNQSEGDGPSMEMS